MRHTVRFELQDEARASIHCVSVAHPVNAASIVVSGGCQKTGIEDAGTEAALVFVHRMSLGYSGVTHVAETCHAVGVLQTLQLC